MRIGFLAWTLFTGKGGIERFSTRISRHMALRGHECVILHQGSGNGYPLYPLHEAVQTFDLAFSDIASIKRVSRFVQEADLDVLCVMNSGSAHLWFPAVCNTTGIPLLMSERTSPAIVESLLWNRKERLACFTAADGIHLLSEHYRYSLPDFLQERVTVIPNPAPKPVVTDWSKELSPRKRLLTVSRFEGLSKRLTLLIQAFSLLHEEFFEWDCCICGDGPDFIRCQTLVRELGLEDRIVLAGSVDNVIEYYKSSHAFCLPSAYEGSPNALLEAQSHGLPSIGFASCTGVNEIIVHGENGMLAPQLSADSLAEALRPVMRDSSLRRKMSERSYELLYRYDESTIFSQWEVMLQKTADYKNATRLNYPDPTEKELAELTLREILSRPHPMNTNVTTTTQHQRKRYTADILRASLAFKRCRKIEDDKGQF